MWIEVEKSEDEAVGCEVKIVFHALADNNHESIIDHRIEVRKLDDDESLLVLHMSDLNMRLLAAAVDYMSRSHPIVAVTSPLTIEHLNIVARSEEP